MVKFGLGGIFVEIFKDAVTVMPPLTREKTADLLQRLKGYPLLTGARGKRPVDLDMLIDTILNFDMFIADYADQLSEVDINPLLVSANGCQVLDALFIPDSD